jgi:hypothetical protein
VWLQAAEQSGHGVASARAGAARAGGVEQEHGGAGGAAGVEQSGLCR